MSRKCSFQAYPRHPHHRMRQSCGTPLLKTVELASQNTVQVLYPYLTYCYLGLECSLQSLLLVPGWALSCEQWREQRQLLRSCDSALEDIYDGRIWKEFQSYHGQPFLSLPNCYGLMMNIDWFQPYKHISYSVGVIYLTIMNLPRHMWHNVLIIGIIPGPHEPAENINSYLEPLVKEFLCFWKGIELDVHGCGKKNVQCALLCCSCDLPAGRKACGFLSYNAQLGCSRCKKRFNGTVGEMDYSGFDRENWPRRTGESHRIDAESLLLCVTKSSFEQMKTQLGCRYSVLLKLPYFNAPRMLIVDPMHNLFLGTAISIG